MTNFFDDPAPSEKTNFFDDDYVAPKSSFFRRAGDYGISALKGAIGVPEAAIGLADIPTGGYAGKIAESLGFRPKDAKAILDDLYSPEQQAANKALSDAKGFTNTIKTALQNPSVIAQTAVESVPLMGAGGLIGRGLATAGKIAPWAAGAIGEGVVGAGSAAENIRQQSDDGLLTLGQSGAAVASGVGTGAFGAAGARIAKKFGIADIDTMLVQGGANTTGRGVFRRLAEGGLTEGVLEELPQSSQEQIWQNAALGKPLLDGVAEAGALGLLTGAAMGGGINVLSGRNAQPPSPDEPAPPLLLENKPDPFISFPDGTVGRQADVENWINSLPENERIPARARLLGYGQQEAAPTIEDITSAPTVDDAIAAANQVVNAPNEIEVARKNEEIDAAWRKHNEALTAQRERDLAAIRQQVADQQVEQAEALTQAQGFDTQEPTAMQLAMQQAQARRKLLLTPKSQRDIINQDQSQGAQDVSKDIRLENVERNGSGIDGARIAMADARELSLRNVPANDAQTEAETTIAPDVDATATQQENLITGGNDVTTNTRETESRLDDSRNSDAANAPDNIANNRVIAGSIPQSSLPAAGLQGVDIATPANDSGNAERTGIVQSNDGPANQNDRGFADVSANVQTGAANLERQVSANVPIPNDGATSAASTTPNASSQQAGSKSTAQPNNGATANTSQTIPAGGQGVSDVNRAGEPVALTGIKAEVARAKTEAAMPAAQASALVQDQGKIVERYLGRYGQGMSGANARMEVRRRESAQPGIKWTTEARDDLGYDRYEVVGRKPIASQQKADKPTKKEIEQAPPASAEPATDEYAFTGRGIFNTDGLTRDQARHLIQSKADKLASTLNEKGFEVKVDHSGSAAGPSSYVSIYDPETGRSIKQQIRFSSHAKGVFNTEGVIGVGSDRDIESVIKMADEMRKLGKTANHSKNLEDEKAFADGRGEYFNAILKIANKKLAKGKTLTKNEQKALDINAKQEQSAKAEPEPAAPAQETTAPQDAAAKAESILDAANIKGKERLDTLKDVKSGALTVDEVARAHPSHDAMTMDDYTKTIANIKNGEVSVDDVKTAYQNLKDSEATIKQEMKGKKKDELLAAGGGMFIYRNKNENKSTIINGLYDLMIESFAYIKADSISYSLGGKDNAVDKIVESITQEDLARHSQQISERKKAIAEKAKAQEEGIANPQSAEDYRAIMRKKMSGGLTFTQARLELTPEQRAEYDKLEAEKTRTERLNNKDEEKANIRTSGQVVDGEIIETKHTKKGHDLFVVKLSERVSREDYETLNNAAKKIGGYYSSFRGNGAIAGFQFQDKATAEAFVQLAQGDKSAAQEAVNARRDAFADDRSQTAVERLTEMADAMDEKADDKLNGDRKTNTDRRARFANAIEKKARENKAMAQTMRNIANAIENGSAKFLDKVRQKTQVQLLQTIVHNAHSDIAMEQSREGKGQYDKLVSDPIKQSDASHAAWPQYTGYRSDLANLGRQLSEVDGTKKLGQQILSVADDVTDAYTKFAKENLGKVSGFALKNGGLAIVPSMSVAENAIARGGFKGKAIPLQIKRGQVAVILSPAEAQRLGIWTGDDDKKITLKPEFGAELVEKIGKAARRGAKVSIPWQFESTYDRRKTLARMGIETPFELRAAIHEFIGLRDAPKEADKIKQLERSMVGRQHDGLDFFPTPSAIVDTMIEAAEITPGMHVLEPSAGWGHIADQIRDAGVEPDVIELSNSRKELLEAKGYNVVGGDFLSVKDGGYDRIIMNPPFSDRRDIAHVQHAYELLNPGGRLVAIVGEGTFFGKDKKAQAFREWLDSVNGTDEKLEEGTFLDPSLPVNTGANARMIVVDKSNNGNGDPNSHSILEAQSTNTPRAKSGLTAADLTKALIRLRAKWTGFTKITIVQSLADLPADIRSSTNPSAKTEGFYHPRTKAVYLIADNIASPERAAWVAAHEVIGHGGLRMLKDKTVIEALNIAGANSFVRRLAKAITKDRSNVSEQIAIEEAISELAAATETDDFQALAKRYGVEVPSSARNGLRGAVARVLDAIKRFLSVAIGKPIESVSDADVRALIIQQRNAVEGRSATSRQNNESGILASISDGISKITDSPAFRRWFGDSKIVDANGEPLAVYHGTKDDITTFDPSKTADGGIHFGTSAQANMRVSGQGKNIMRVYLSANDLQRSKDMGGNWKAKIKAAKASGKDGIVYLNRYEGLSSDVIARLSNNGLLNKLDSMSDAEFRRAVPEAEDSYIVFKPNQIKSVTGNNGNFDPDSPSILESQSPTTEHIPKWAENLKPEVQDALRKAGAIYEEKTLKQKIVELKTGAIKKLQYGIFDQFAPIKDAVGAIPYIKARMAKSADGTLEAMMLYGSPSLDADEGMRVDTAKKGFIEIMQALNGEHDRFFSWMAGRRAAELKKQGRENLFMEGDISALATLNQGKREDGTSRESAYLRAQMEVAALNKAVLDIAEKSGLIDAESRKVWASDFYVPFYRVMEEGVTGPSIKSGLVNQKSIKMLKGGTNNLNDLTQNMLMNWSTLLASSAKNRAARATLDAATGIGIATEADETTIRQMGKAAKTKAVSYMDGGVNRWFVVEDEHLLAAISALEFNGYNNDAMKVMTAFKNVLTKVVTVTPLFKVRNLIRDSVSTIAVSQLGPNPLANAWKGGKLLVTDKALRADMVAGGGVFRFGTMLDGDRGAHVKNLIDAGVKDETILDTKEKMKAFLQKIWDGYQEAGDISENANRATLYNKLRNEGKSHLEASFEARDLMDFGLSGAWAGVRALNQVLPFFNARLQGMYKLGRGYNDDPKRMGYVVGAVALASVALLAAFKDDDDFKKRTESDRNNYWWFKIGQTAYRLPKPFEIGAMGSAIEHFTALIIDSDNTDSKRFMHQMGDLINGQLSMNPIPQLFRPMIDVYSNKDAFSGRPIESLAMQRLKPEDRYTYNTSEIARMLSGAGVLIDPISFVAGTGVKRLSPVQIDSLIRGYFSGLGVFATSTVDSLLHHSVIDRGEALPLTLKDFAGSFAERLPSNSSRYVDMLYTTALKIEQSYGSYTNAIKRGDTEEARAIFERDREYIAKYHMVESLKKNESIITRQIQKTMNSKTMTGEQKDIVIRRLKATQDRIARAML